ncbi:MAG TPA: YafY family protein [Chitinophagaceae bacterium]|jgi:predicted DNA-binding transcriptional regulator YafY|nr:YafY family protein [Chitinophagaceae bacterium]
MNRIDRLFGILTLLQSKKYVTGEKIAEKFHISIRSVYRDIKALNEQGIPVSFEPYRGYFVVNGYFLPPVSFSTEEANALLLMESIVAGFADKSIHKHYSTALTKVKAVLRSSQKDSIERLASNIKFQASPCFVQHYDYLATIQQAIGERQVIEIEYTNAKKEISKRKAEPIGLVFYAFSWHLIGWCHIKKDYRDFKVSRILRITSTTENFTKTDHVTMTDYMKLLPVDY